MALARRRSAFDDRPDSMVHICRLHGVRLTRLRIQIASIFDETDEPLDAQMIWSRLRAQGAAGNLTSIYRLLRDMKLAGAIHLVMTQERREFFHKRRGQRSVDLLNVANQSLTTVVDDDLIGRIEQLVTARGFRLAGRIVVSVAPPRAD